MILIDFFNYILKYLCIAATNTLIQLQYILIWIYFTFDFSFQILYNYYSLQLTDLLCRKELIFMIKLIATDIDGTLVNDEKQLPPDFTDIIDILDKKGISFAVSSGRSYSALIDQFSFIAEKISFICDNGSYIVDKGEIISRSVIPQKAVHEILKTCYENELCPLLCGENGTYYSSKSVEYEQEVARYYNNTVYMEKLYDCRDNIFKIAIYGKDGIETNGLPVLNSRFGSNLTVSLSGYYWVDIMNPGINKGRGIQILQNKLGASYEETMAFGDYLNDIEMLEHAYYSFAMENAHPMVKKTANFSTGTNNEFSVTKEISRLLK